MARRICTILALAVLLANLGGCRKKPPPAGPSPATSPATSPTTSPTTTSTAPTTTPPPLASKPAPALPSATAARQALAGQPFDNTSRKQPGSQSRPAASKPTQEVSNDPLKHIAAGSRALARRDAATAADCFYLALDIKPDHPDALRGLATALATAGRYREAIPIYRMLRNMSPKDPVALYNLAVALSKTGQFAEASRAYRKLLSQDADDVRSRYNLAVLYQAQGRLKDARRTWQEVLARAPHLATAHTLLGEVLIDLGENEDAMMAYAEAAKLTPKSPTAWLNFAAAAEGAGSYGRAIVATKRAAELSPRDAGIWARLGGLHLVLHRVTKEDRFLKDAVAAWRRSLNLDPAQPQLRKYVEAYGPAADNDRPNEANRSSKTGR